MSTTQTGVAPAAAVAATPANSSPDTNQIDGFTSFWDAQNQIDNGQVEEAEEPQDLNNAQTEGDAEQPVEAEAEGEQTEDKADKTVKADKAEKTADKEAEDEKHYESLEQYVKDNGLEPESFMALPVKVRVDGTDQDVPLAELVKGYQLSSASYARMNEAAQERTKIQTEVTQVRGALGVQIKQADTLLKLAQTQLTQDFHGIDWNAIRASDPGQYSALYTDFQARNTAIQKAMKDVADAEQANALAQKQQREQAIPVERTRLLQARPEWADSAKAQTAFRAMSEAARKVGFTDAELNSVTDHRQFLILDMAARYAQLQAKAPATLKRVRLAPKMAPPGTRQTRDPKVSAHKAALTNWARNPRSDDAAAAAFEAFV